MESTLSILPIDIILDVLTPLSEEDLYNVALVSSHLSGSANRLLYRSISLQLRPLSGQDNSLHRLERLVDTLTRKPHLQPYVLRLTIDLRYRFGESRFGDHANLLGLLPNLQILSLQPPPYDFGLSMLASPILQTLHLNFSNGRDHDGNAQVPGPLDIIEHVFWAPQLRRLLVEGVTFDSAFSQKFGMYPSRSSLITDLQFRDCDQQQLGCLPNMLNCIKALERFALEIHTPWKISYRCSKGIEPAMLGQAIGIHAESLVRLEIASSDTAEFCQTSLLGGLAGYPRLKKLAIPDDLLFTISDKHATLVDVLPASLEELQLQFTMLATPPGKDVNRLLRLDRLHQLATTKETRFTALRRVIVWYQPTELWSNDGSCYGPLSDMDDLKAVFQNVGVKFKYLSETYFFETPFSAEENDNLFQS
ncbi:hypothetical protein ONS95_009555 [Cadophora gregata]|uniref:uncharacterized protein n=1 Tax=Cadophora gregata TaxID=51156 RepID=UPI0026DC5EF8|nr:uncharacterized protein ONS95_009555 [Cadophora gregata]KAK0124606.1 hypothetical protein ONS95_009555 [Cadophora gregata]KAK0129537.1 hypothetical protein ONS96_000102 [Cadophora gregata f. sp. sojae]